MWSLRYLHQPVLTGHGTRQFGQAMSVFAGLAAYVLILALVLGGGFFGAASFMKSADVRSAAAARISDQQAKRKTSAIHAPASPPGVERRANVPRESGSKSRASIGSLHLKASDDEIWRGRQKKRSPRQ
jgi:hypothetical protein